MRLSFAPAMSHWDLSSFSSGPVSSSSYVLSSDSKPPSSTFFVYSSDRANSTDWQADLWYFNVPRGFSDLVEYSRILGANEFEPMLTGNIYINYLPSIPPSNCTHFSIVSDCNWSNAGVRRAVSNTRLLSWRFVSLHEGKDLKRWNRGKQHGKRTVRS